MTSTQISGGELKGRSGRMMNGVTLNIVTADNVPSFKNRKRAIVVNGTPRTLTEPKIKKRVNKLENAILSALYSACRTVAPVTDMEWLKQLRTLLSGLSDDSLQQIPESSFAVEYVEKGREGVLIQISEL